MFSKYFLPEMNKENNVNNVKISKILDASY